MHCLRSFAHPSDRLDFTPKWDTQQSPPSSSAAPPYVTTPPARLPSLTPRRARARARFIYGLGGTVDFTRQWHARFDWDRTEGQDNINPKYDVDAFTLGFGFRF